jgi:hypothetical protein
MISTILGKRAFELFCSQKAGDVDAITPTVLSMSDANLRSKLMQYAVR